MRLINIPLSMFELLIIASVHYVAMICMKVLEV